MNDRLTHISSASILSLLLSSAIFTTTKGTNAQPLEKHKNDSLYQKRSPFCVTVDDLKCPRDDIIFQLYTRSPFEKGFSEVIGTKVRYWELDQAPFVDDAPLKVIVHGYQSDVDSPNILNLKDAYLIHSNNNILLVDWSALDSGSHCYIYTGRNVPTIATCIAQLINQAMRYHRFPSIHLLGHSMGAHIVSQASNKMYKVNRITEFDTARPGWFGMTAVPGKAHFIDVYHSNGGYLGRQEEDGHVDVYFNNEAHQPGCGCNIACSHRRAIQYFTEGVRRPDMFVALKCRWGDYVNGRCRIPAPRDLFTVGENIKWNTRGSYLVFTNDKPPFLIDPAGYTTKSTFFGFKEKYSNICL